MGHLHGVPHQLHSDDPHRGHLAHLLPRHMEVHDQVKLAEKLLIKNSLSRFIMIKFPSEAATLCTVARCKIVLVLGFGQYYHRVMSACCEMIFGCKKS